MGFDEMLSGVPHQHLMESRIHRLLNSFCAEDLRSLLDNSVIYNECGLPHASEYILVGLYQLYTKPFQEPYWVRDW